MARSSYLNAFPNLLLMITPLHYDQAPCHFPETCGLLGSIGMAHHSAQYDLKTGKNLKHISNPTNFLSKKIDIQRASESFSSQVSIPPQGIFCAAQSLLFQGF